MSSPALAWPDTCTFAFSFDTTRAPRRVRSLMTRYTEFSLPGISEEASTTISPGSIVTVRWDPTDMRDNAAIGSPCEPVAM